MEESGNLCGMFRVYDQTVGITCVYYSVKYLLEKLVTDMAWLHLEIQHVPPANNRLFDKCELVIGVKMRFALPK